MTDHIHAGNGSKPCSTVGRVYRRPELVPLGSLRDMTMSSSNFGANDGMPNMGTKRGGDFRRGSYQAA